MRERGDGRKTQIISAANEQYNSLKSKIFGSKRKGRAERYREPKMRKSELLREMKRGE